MQTTPARVQLRYGETGEAPEYCAPQESIRSAEKHSLPGLKVMICTLRARPGSKCGAESTKDQGSDYGAGLGRIAAL